MIKKQIFVSIALLVLIPFCVWGGYIVVDEARIARVRKGDTVHDVIAILGQPSVSYSSTPTGFMFGPDQKCSVATTGGLMVYHRRFRSAALVYLTHNKRVACIVRRPYFVIGH